MSRDLARLEEDRALILAGVSHDLRTPLSRLRLGIEMSGGDASLRQGMAADIEEMDRIIGQFLDFARSNSEETSDAVDLAAIAADLVRHYGDIGHPLKADIAADAAARAAPPVDTPRRRQPRRQRPALRGRRQSNCACSREGRAAVIEVLDRGPGIPPEHAERLKQPFTRLESARSECGRLRTRARDRRSHRALHGGSLDLLPRDGGGLRARITLP